MSQNGTEGLTRMQRILWETLLEHARKNPNPRHQYAIRIADLQGSATYEWGDEAQLKNALKALHTVRIEWTAESDDKETWTRIVMLPKVGIVNDMVFFDVHPLVNAAMILKQ